MVKTKSDSKRSNKIKFGFSIFFVILLLVNFVMIIRLIELRKQKKI